MFVTKQEARENLESVLGGCEAIGGACGELREEFRETVADGMAAIRRDIFDRLRPDAITAAVALFVEDHGRQPTDEEVAALFRTVEAMLESEWRRQARPVKDQVTTLRDEFNATQEQVAIAADDTRDQLRKLIARPFVLFGCPG